MKYIIIGSGAAGSTAAETIRKIDGESSIEIFTKEPYPFYYRPRIIDYITGKVDINKLIMHDMQWHEQKNIKLHLDTEITQIDPENKVIHTEKQSYSYDKLLIACGAKSRIPAIDNIKDVKNCFTLQTIADADRIIECSKKSKTVLILGGGLLGIETANSLADRGLQTEIVDISDRILPRQLDMEGSLLLQTMLESKHISFILNDSARSVSESEGSCIVKFNSTSDRSYDMMILSAGVIPNLDQTKNLPIEQNKGIIVNSKMETSIENIFAAGDVAEYNNHIYGIWMPSREQGEIAGVNMAGGQKDFTGFIPAHKLKVAGIDLSSRGTLEGEATLIHKTQNEYFKIFTSGGKLSGAIMLGKYTGEEKLAAAIKEGKKPEEVLPLMNLPYTEVHK